MSELTIGQAATQALQEHAAAKAIRALGRKSQSPSGEGIRTALDKAWHRLAELKTDPARYKTT